MIFYDDDDWSLFFYFALVITDLFIEIYLRYLVTLSLQKTSQTFLNFYTQNEEIEIKSPFD